MIGLDAVKREKDCEVARSYVDFLNGLAIDRHTRALVCAEDLVALAEVLAVEPTTQVPVKIRIVAVMEDADVSLMRTAPEGLLGKELVQLVHRSFEVLD